MHEKYIRRTSKFLSLVLRHQPEKIGIRLDEAGWVDVDVLLEAMARRGKRISRETLENVVRTNDKQRFSLSEDGRRIRANQGHTVDVALGYATADPPEILLHGTPTRFLDAIRREGLKKMKRHHVHLHVDEATAIAVGTRRGKPVLLKVWARDMARRGHEFFVTPNNVWLTDHVPPEFIEFPQ
jgi:putative RNA 2'-phosphotransferase